MFEYLVVYGELDDREIILQFSIRQVEWSNQLEARTVFTDGTWESEDDKNRFDVFIPTNVLVSKVELEYEF